MTYKIYLDDLRVPSDSIKHSKIPQLYVNNNEWVIVRNYDEFVNTITSRQEVGQWPMFISYDHDLGIEHTKFFWDNGGFRNPPNPDDANFTEKTGLDCAKWLCEYVMNNKLPLPGFAVHSANPVGRKNIQTYLENFNKHYEQMGK